MLAEVQYVTTGLCQNFKPKNWNQIQWSRCWNYFSSFCSPLAMEISWKSVMVLKRPSEFPRSWFAFFWHLIVRAKLMVLVVLLWPMLKFLIKLFHKEKNVCKFLTWSLCISPKVRNINDAFNAPNSSEILRNSGQKLGTYQKVIVVPNITPLGNNRKF